MASCNRLLQKKWDDRKFREHKERLRSTKSTIDNGFPREFVHIRENKRKKQIEHDKQVIIQRHNAQLLDRMHTIMHTTGRVEHRNADWRPKRSVNFVKKKREMEKITRENQDLLKRLQTVQPQYSTRKWEEDFQEHHSRARSMQLFPAVQQSQSPNKLGRLRSEIPALPPIITAGSPRPETQPMSEIREEIDVDN